ncbi:PEP-CTERM sorting domain-containing protein [Aquincola sp. MAHUQ-54]|uniref:PEP-CTERM sorting domain-containing protein n=1 Tax=Aquincola agrisoli TaxID=3119538 RepID=A0AAW9QBL9_9BURK
MIKRIIVTCLAALALSSAHAAPVTFTNTLYTVDAIALTDGDPSVESKASPPDDLTLFASAASDGLTTDLATAGAISGAGLLSASADVSAGGIASAVGSASFIGSFTNSAPMVTLSIGFDASSFASGTANSSASLFVELISSGVTLYSDFVTGPWEFSYTPAAGTLASLQLTLTAESAAGVSALGLGNASATGLATFAVSAVPEPSTYLLMLGGLALLARARRR